MSLNINNSLVNQAALTTKTVTTQAASAETETAATVAPQNGATAQVDTSYTAIANDVLAANLGVQISSSNQPVSTGTPEASAPATNQGGGTSTPETNGGTPDANEEELFFDVKKIPVGFMSEPPGLIDIDEKNAALTENSGNVGMKTTED